MPKRMKLHKGLITGIWIISVLVMGEPVIAIKFAEMAIAFALCGYGFSTGLIGGEEK